MLFIKQNPFLKFFVYAYAGVIGTSFIEPHSLDFGILFFVLSFLFAAFILLITHSQTKRSFRFRWLPGLISAVLVILFFFVYSSCRQVEELPITGNVTIQGRVGEVVSVRQNKWRFSVDVFKLENDTLLVTGPIRALVSVTVDSGSVNDYVGRSIKGQGMVMEMPKTQFPYQFDYGAFLQRSGYSLQLFLSDISLSDSIETISFVSSPFVWLRKHFRNQFAVAMNDKSLQGVVQALIMGDRSQIDVGLRDAYVKAGAIHILAVSGMHVGILFLLISTALSFLRRYKVVFTLSCLSFLWFYAGLTGCPPSVLRATIMFSVLLIGGQIARKTPIYNLLAFSGFVIAVIDPNHLFNAGFWLSHFAVLGIVMFYQRINAWFSFGFPPFRWLWSIVAVSLSAQVFTFPLILMFFNGFPVYFVLSNILVLPMVSLSLVGSLLLAVLPANTFLFDMVAGLVASLVTFMNDSAVWVASLSGAYWQHISLAIWEALLYVVAVFMVMQYYELRCIRLFWSSSVAILLLVVSLVWRVTVASSSNAVFADIKRNSGFVSVNAGRQNILIVTSDKALAQAKVNLTGYWGQQFSKDPTIVYTDSVKSVTVGNETLRIEASVFTEQSYFFERYAMNKSIVAQLWVCLEPGSEFVLITDAQGNVNELYALGPRSIKRWGGNDTNKLSPKNVNVVPLADGVFVGLY